DGQIGLESTPDQYVAKLVEIFREVRRVLRGDGVLFLNLGDSYAHDNPSGPQGKGGDRASRTFTANGAGGKEHGLKPKDLVGIPWSVAKALQQSYYTGRIAIERDRIWLAATIDAEGSICGFHHTRRDDGSLRTGIHLTITNTNRVMLDNAYRIWPTSRQDHNRHGEGHYGEMPCWRWIAHDVDEKAALLRELYPYFVCKQKQALLAWNFLELSKDAKRLGHSTEAQATKERRSWIVHSLTHLNHLEPVDMPDWIKEPPSMFEPGWWLRQDIIWSKPNPMPESVTDRCTKAHEYIFLLSKAERYYYDAKAVAEPSVYPESLSGRRKRNDDAFCQSDPEGKARTRVGFAKIEAGKIYDTRNRRSVWEITTKPYKEAHFATFPPEIPRICILAGSKPGDTICDPFAGSGTSGAVAQELGRNAILIELNPAYCELIRRRTAQTGMVLA
ncbi:MAG TPA: site-specific DNA-methyltransferase, partial [Terracidiphilus sp.]|nr:site-specific DNA-methyltransferase [Terracidiphilus sp.]